jgi:membrane protein YdbS with pleckstrin-like domain
MRYVCGIFTINAICAAVLGNICRVIMVGMDEYNISYRLFIGVSNMENTCRLVIFPQVRYTRILWAIQEDNLWTQR